MKTGKSRKSGVKKHEADKFGRDATNCRDATSSVSTNACAEAKEQIPVFLQDLNSLISSRDELKYLKSRIDALSGAADYKTIAQFFRIAALSLKDELDKFGRDAINRVSATGRVSTNNRVSATDALKLEEACGKVRELESLLSQKESAAEVLNKKIEDFKLEFIELRKKADGANETVVDNTRKNLFFSLLPVLDNFLLAVNARTQSNDLNKICDGFAMIYDQLKKIMEKEGLTEVSFLGKQFDPKFHELIQQVDGSPEESGKIVEEARRAYFYRNKLVRPAMVKVVK